MRGIKEMATIMTIIRTNCPDPSHTSTRSVNVFLAESSGVQRSPLSQHAYAQSSLPLPVRLPDATSRAKEMTCDAHY